MNKIFSHGGIMQSPFLRKNTVSSSEKEGFWVMHIHVIVLCPEVHAQENSFIG